MSQNLDTAKGATFTDGLRKLKDILTAAKPLNDNKLVRKARQTVEQQVARLSSVKPADITMSTAQAYTIPNRYRYVRFPTSSDNSDPSGVTVFFDVDGNHSSTVESLVTNTGPGACRVQLWQNGKLVADQSFEENSGRRIQPEFSWDVLKDCLSHAGGGDWWVIAGITAACAAVCIATDGLACEPCIAAASGITRGAITNCITKAINS